MRAHIWFILGLAGHAAACAERRQTILGPDELYDARAKSGILFITSPETAVAIKARAFEPSLGEPLFLDRPEGAELRLELLIYDETLTELGLHPGALPRARPEAVSVALPSTEVALEAPLVETDGDPGWRPVTFEQTQGLAWKLPTDMEVRPCDRIEVAAWDLLGAGHVLFDHVVAVSESTAVVAGGRHLGIAQAPDMYTPVLDASFELTISDLAIDSSGTVYAATSSTTLLVVDPETRTITATRTLPFESAKLTLVRDDAFFAYREEPPSVVHIQLPEFTLESVDVPLPPFQMEAQARDLLVVRRRGPNEIHVFDGVTWTKELHPDDFVNVRNVTADVDRFVIVADERPAIRHRSEGTWEFLPPRGNVIDLRDVALLQDDIYLVVGGAGVVIAWIDGEACDIDNLINRASRGVAATADGRVAFSTHWKSNTRPDARIVRYQVLPEL